MNGIYILIVLLSAVLSTAVGAFWYSQTLFGKRWMKEWGASLPPSDEMKGKKMTMMYAAAFVTELIIAIALLLFSIASRAVITPVAVALLAWAGFVIPLLASSVLYERKSKIYYSILVGHRFVSFLVAGIVIALLL